MSKRVDHYPNGTTKTTHHCDMCKEEKRKDCLVFPSVSYGDQLFWSFDLCSPCSTKFKAGIKTMFPDLGDTP